MFDNGRPVSGRQPRGGRSENRTVAWPGLLVRHRHHRAEHRRADQRYHSGRPRHREGKLHRGRARVRAARSARPTTSQARRRMVVRGSVGVFYDRLQGDVDLRPDRQPADRPGLDRLQLDAAARRGGHRCVAAAARPAHLRLRREDRRGHSMERRRADGAARGRLRWTSRMSARTTTTRWRSVRSRHRRASCRST